MSYQLEDTFHWKTHLRQCNIGLYTLRFKYYRSSYREKWLSKARTNFALTQSVSPMETFTWGLSTRYRKVWYQLTTKDCVIVKCGFISRTHFASTQTVGTERSASYQWMKFRFSQAFFINCISFDCIWGCTGKIVSLNPCWENTFNCATYIKNY